MDQKCRKQALVCRGEEGFRESVPSPATAADTIDESEEAKSITYSGLHRGAWRRIKRLLAPAAALLLLLLKFGAKLKFVLFLLPKVKFIGTAVTMILSVGAYALLFPLWFAVGFVILILVHELGHVFQLRREGVPATAPMFIPFFGAFVGMKELPRDAAAEARVGLAGPVAGTLGALGAWGLYALTEQPVYLGLAYVGFLLNLFNLLPTLPLDGGRAVSALSPAIWVLGLAAAAVFLVRSGNPLLLLILIFGGIELWHRWKNRHSEESREYHRIAIRDRLAIGGTYLGLAALLVLFMSATYVPNPADLI